MAIKCFDVQVIISGFLLVLCNVKEILRHRSSEDQLAFTDRFVSKGDSKVLHCLLLNSAMLVICVCLLVFIQQQVTQWSRIFLENLVVVQLAKFPAFLGMQKYDTATGRYPQPV